ncbi:MAG: type II secretion system F family protein [Thermofilaceae archaeon]
MAPGWVLNLAKRLSEKAGVFKEIYYTAGFEEPFESYLGKWLIAYIALTPAITAFLVYLHGLVLKYPLLFTIILTAIVLVIYTLLFTFLLLYYPVYRRYSRGVGIDSRLPYTIAYFAALASSGMGLEAIVERVAEVEEVKATRRELELFLTEVKLLGLDVLSALDRRSRASPSILLSLFFSGLRDAYITAGNLYEYAAFMARRLLEMKRNELRNIVNSISMVAEMYVTLMVAAPLMFVVMLAVIAMMGGAVGGLPPQLLIALILVVGIPASAAATLVILDGILSKV